MPALAQHSLLEFYDCRPARLKRAREVQVILRKAVLQGGGTIVREVFHNFSPHGVSGVIVITESHVAIHTWPEHNYAAVDIFTCSRKLDHTVIRDALRDAFSARRVVTKTFRRGPSMRVKDSKRTLSNRGMNPRRAIGALQ